MKGSIFGIDPKGKIWLLYVFLGVFLKGRYHSRQEEMRDEGHSSHNFQNRAF